MSTIPFRRTTWLCTDSCDKKESRAYHARNLGVVLISNSRVGAGAPLHSLHTPREEAPITYGKTRKALCSQCGVYIELEKIAFSTYLP